MESCGGGASRDAHPSNWSDSNRINQKIHCQGTPVIEQPMNYFILKLCIAVLKLVKTFALTCL